MKNCLTIASLSLLLPVVAIAGVSSLEWSFAETAFTGPGTAMIMVVPDGSGAPFTAARLTTGPVDATITLYLRDNRSQPIVDFPREDLWLESGDGGLVPCSGGTIADYNTDAAGTTVWSAPLRAGGASEDVCLVLVNGLALASSNGFPIGFNSPDTNADGIVNLSDLHVFVGDLNGAYNFRSDLAYDGAVNLSDVVQMVNAFGRSCP